MIYGFTGTQAGMTEFQKAVLRHFFISRPVAEFHLGDCIGADAEAYDIAVSYKVPCIGHPPTDSVKRAFKRYAWEWPKKPYLIRNKDIVACSGAMLAAPKGYQMETRSGTWATVRAAISAKVQVALIFPNGAVHYV